MTVVSPAFRDGRHIGFFASTAHVVDIGGRGFGPDANDVHEEGLTIPITKFADRGTVSAEVVRFVRANVRAPDAVVGDLYSLAACNASGDRRLQEMMTEFRIDDLEALSEFIIDTSRKATRACIAALPPGRYENEMQVDGYDAPVRMKVTLNVDGDTLVADFAGTSGTSSFGVTRSHGLYARLCLLRLEVCHRAGGAEQYRLARAVRSDGAGRLHPERAQAGAGVGAARPGASGAGRGAGRLAPLSSRQGSGRRASALWNIQISARPVEVDSGLPSAEVLMFNSGGTGARPTLDGLSATAFPSGVKTMSIEATEHVGPIVVWRKDLREGSGGPGEHRGGLGQTIEIEPRDGYAFHFNAMFDRIENPARGRNGGGPGASGGVAWRTAPVCAAKAGRRCRPGRAWCSACRAAAATAIPPDGHGIRSGPTWRRATSRRIRPRPSISSMMTRG